MSEEIDGQARRRRDRLPRNRQRERVLRMVREHDGAIDAVELAAQIGLHVTTVRFHLDVLCDEGVILRTRVNLPGAGRPRTGYLPVEEPLDYRALAEVLAMELGQNVETRARRAQRAGQKWAARMTAAQCTHTDRAERARDADDTLDQVAHHATEVFTRMGFAAELASTTESATPPPAAKASIRQRERIIRLHACPVRELARAHREVGCGVHLGLLHGLVADSAADGDDGDTQRPTLSAHLEPFVEPELCLARLVED